MLELPPNHTHPLSRIAWRDWLSQHHGRDEGVWVVSYKKATGKPRMTYDEAVEEAMAFGWVDSLQRKLDADRSMLYFAPRKPGSGWSAANKRRVEKLIASGKMHEAGLSKIEAAKADGSWALLDEVEALVVPPDLERAFQQYPGSAEHFAAFPPSARRGILEWIVQAKKPETRARRVDETARLAAENVRANQWARKG